MLLVLLMIPLSASAQVLCTLGAASSSYDAYADQRPTSDAMELAGQVNAALAPVCTPNCPVVALFRNASVPKAIMVVASGQAKLIYSPKFFTSVYEEYGDGAIIGIIAHELGHAINETAPAAWMKSGWTPELRADAWAGCALAKVNLSARRLEATLTAISMNPSPAHPGWAQRIPALRLGYAQCGGDGPKFDAGIGGVKRK